MKKILPPVLHIKSGIGGKILAWEFKNNPGAISHAKAKYGTNFEPNRIQGKQVNLLLKDDEFTNILTPNGKNVWLAFGKVVTGFLGRKRHPSFQLFVKRLIKLLSENDIKMTLKIHFLRDHLDKFPDSCSDYSDEAGERIHKDVKDSIRRTRHQAPKHFIIDYCWRLFRDNVTNRPIRKPCSKRFFKI